MLVSRLPARVYPVVVLLGHLLRHFFFHLVNLEKLVSKRLWVFIIRRVNCAVVPWRRLAHNIDASLRSHLRLFFDQIEHFPVQIILQELVNLVFMTSNLLHHLVQVQHCDCVSDPVHTREHVR